MPQLNVQDTLVEGGAGFLAGGGQRMAWEASEQIGLITTGAVLLGGIAVNMFSNAPLLRQVGMAATISGASVGGWVAAEKFLIEGSQGRTIGHLPAQQRRQMAEAEARRAMFAGRANGVVQHAMVPLNDDEITVL